MFQVDGPDAIKRRSTERAPTEARRQTCTQDVGKNAIALCCSLLDFLRSANHSRKPKSFDNALRVSLDSSGVDSGTTVMQMSIPARPEPQASWRMSDMHTIPTLKSQRIIRGPQTAWNYSVLRNGWLLVAEVSCFSFEMALRDEPGWLQEQELLRHVYQSSCWQLPTDKILLAKLTATEKTAGGTKDV
ncbi:hypothetical protein BO78DRAFT_242425 [Aspergillus sclerotiicarbonarius CBS 121057]|uniref:Uncharacterized protein n=1 Tax=Aspergillus sclerotiicarbonarius (strain CBS 121057 / IBT 28362) TaxID=1448318 RepID=A0A319DVP1_ASPSB|nr:hypothetical protein BO78DRAFT_242425 [Aspergillus sclerotiicarbonarius CBS 121057]